MKVVPRFEANLLRILHFFLQRAPLEQGLPLILERLPQPSCLTRAGVELVQDSLAKGCVWLLARGGGWRKEQHLRAERKVAGRLWERTPPAELGLSFSKQSLRFLIWITAVKPDDHKPRWGPAVSELTPADQLLCYLAYTALRDTEVGSLLRKRPPFFGNALCRLACAEDFSEPPEGGGELDWKPWTSGLGACILEAMQPELTRRWVQAERGKAQVTDWQRLRRLGRAQEIVLTSFTGALEASGRRDLARFLLQAAAGLLGEDSRPASWVGGLQGTGMRLADRVETYQAALVFLRHLAVLAQWERWARGVGYLDEGYEAAKLWKEDWERGRGEQLHSRAQAIIHQLDYWIR